jgi:hypothetical protein
VKILCRSAPQNEMLCKRILRREIELPESTSEDSP